MTPSSPAISPLRQRMIDDMSIGVRSASLHPAVLYVQRQAFRAKVRARRQT